jgi:H+-transporting ATPase
METINGTDNMNTEKRCEASKVGQTGLGSKGMLGLSSEEAEKRLQKFGPNEIPEKKRNPILKFLSYFWGPIPWMIEVAVVLSAILAHWDDFGIISALLMVNAVVGFWQENKADNAIELLKQRLAVKARVLRDGKWKEMAAKDLVPGDVVRVRLGDIVPADIKLVDGDYLLVNESALTGESLPVEKHVSHVAYASSIVQQGEMNGRVVGTGISTYFGKTTRLAEELTTQSHFQKAVIKIGNYLIALAVTLVAIVFLVALFRNESVLETLQFALVLTVAAIPVALPAVLTVTMAVGAVALAKKEAIVSKLVSIEEMAGVDILFSDKTGTITKNELTVGEVRPLNGFTDDDVILTATLASKEENQDPIDNAIINRAKAMNPVADLLARYDMIDFKPFDPVCKRTEAAIADPDNGDSFKVAKGAPQVILSLVSDKDAVSKRVYASVNELAEKGYRALGVAKTDKRGNYKFVGILGLYDPPREDSAKTIETARSMGVKVKMVTGDHIAIAKEVAREVNLGTKIMPASAFLDAHNSDAEHIVESADGFAEVFPEHKYRIVELLQKNNHIVGMTGDGINDVPALKKADAGIAVAGAADAAKSAADVVLTKLGLSVIIDTIKETRKTFQRMNNYAIYRVAETIRVLLFLTAAILIFNFYPLTAVMIVMIAMLNDIPIMMIAYDKAKVLEKPVRWDMRKLLTISTVLGVMGVFSSFTLFWIGANVLLLDAATLQTLIFLKLAVAGHMTIYLARTGGDNFWTRPLPAGSLFWTTEMTQLVGTIFAVYGIFMKPIGWELAAFIWGYSLMFFIVNNFVKVHFYRVAEHNGALLGR